MKAIYASLALCLSCSRQAPSPLEMPTNITEAATELVAAPLIAREAKCTIRGVLPDHSCTPGVIETRDLKVICEQSTKERRSVPASVHRQAFEEYGIAFPQPPGEYEVDHLISLELGGSNDIDNLWPEQAPHWRTKDKVENVLHKRVCSGKMTIEAAQHMIADDWTQALVWLPPQENE